MLLIELDSEEEAEVKETGVASFLLSEDVLFKLGQCSSTANYVYVVDCM